MLKRVYKNISFSKLRVPRTASLFQKYLPGKLIRRMAIMNTPQSVYDLVVSIQTKLSLPTAIKGSMPFHSRTSC